MNGRLIFIPLIALGFLLSQCDRVGGNSFDPSPADFVSNQHTQVLLKRPLREISGVDFVSEKELIAVNDEAGKIFLLDPRNGNHEVFEFGTKGDYEDVIKVGDKFYVLNSNGSLFMVDENTKRQEQVYIGEFGKHMEFESICYDRSKEQILLICKECGKAQNSINAYSFNLVDKTFSNTPYFSVSWKEIRKMAKDNSIECKPSAAAINPVNQKLYVIASLGKVLLEMTTEGKLENVYNLNPDHFPQPEGITFGSNGDMYISNEGIQGKASLLLFKYKGKG